MYCKYYGTLTVECLFSQPFIPRISGHPFLRSFFNNPAFGVLWQGNQLSRKTIAVLFGGISVEHEISLASSRFVFENLDSSKFDTLAVFISKNGKWQRALIKNWLEGETPALVPNSELIAMFSSSSPGRFMEITGGRIEKIFSVDVIFPVLHGTFGEDGTVQGLADLMGVPCVGADVLGSSLCMDKIISKTILRDRGLSVVPFFDFVKTDWIDRKQDIVRHIREEIRFPCFVKCSNLGSSVGIYKVDSVEFISKAVDSAFEFSHRVLVERAVLNPREVEVGVIGDISHLLASDPGELLLKGDFYDYSRKYGDNMVEFRIPCELNPDLRKKIKDLAIQACSVLCCSGMARVDFLVSSTDKVFISEVNTIPGLTPMSMYPKLLETEGFSSEKMIETLISLAEQRYRAKKELRTDFSSL